MAKPLKRVNGTGTIIDFGSRSMLRYGARVTIKVLDGKQYYKWIGRWKTKKEARTYLDLYNVGEYVPPDKITFKTLFVEWKAPYYLHISKQLQDNYNASYNHLKPIIDKPFNDLKAKDFQSIIDNLDKSQSTKKKIKVLAGLLYKYAMQNDICNKDYAQFIKIEKEVKDDKVIFTDKEIDKLWEIEEETYSILVLIYTGFRLQEMLNLTKSDIDIENMVITGGLKTDAGKDREVPIHTKIQPIIKKLYDNATDRLFFKGKNLVISQNYYREYIYYPLLNKLNISNNKNPHTTRHTCATLLARGGADTLAIQRLLGHTKYSFTADTYTRSNIEELRKAIETL